MLQLTQSGQLPIQWEKGRQTFLRSAHAVEKRIKHDYVGVTFNSWQQKISNIIVVLFVSFLLDTKLRIIPEIFGRF